MRTFETIVSVIVAYTAINARFILLISLNNSGVSMATGARARAPGPREIVNYTPLALITVVIRR